MISEGIFNQSLGKIVTNKYVAKANGGKPSFGNILLRSICRFIPFEAFSYLPSPMSKWHDKFSNTDVFEVAGEFEDSELEFSDNYNANAAMDSNATFDPGRWDEE